MTSRADDELSALRIELLRTRAEVERMQLLQQLDAIDGRTRAVRGVASAMLGRQRASHHVLNVAATAIGFIRRQSWVLPALGSVVARLLRIRSLRWLLLAGAAGATLWWFARGTSVPGEAAEDTADGIDNADT